MQAGSGYILGSKQSVSVEISDAEDQDYVRNLLSNANQAVLPEVFSAMGSQTMNAVDGRVEQYFKNDSKNSLIVDGNSQITDILTSSGKSLANDSTNLREVIGNASFLLNVFEETEQQFQILPQFGGLGGHSRNYWASHKQATDMEW